jgi:membrane protease YdiL (CAAX protease family)
MLSSRTWSIFLVAVLVGEFLINVSPAATAIIDALVVVAALTQFGWAQRSPLAIGDTAGRLLPAVALVALMRLLSLTMPVPSLPPVMWIVLAGGPLLVAVAATARLLVLNARDLGLTRRPRSVFTVSVIVLSAPAGLLLGAVAPYNPIEGVGSPMFSGLVAAAVVSCAVIPEELVFRGILQPLLSARVGRLSVIVATLAFAATYVGSGSVVVVALLGFAGLAYGVDAARTGSLWGPLLGHSILSVTATVIGPALAHTPL